MRKALLCAALLWPALTLAATSYSRAATSYSVDVAKSALTFTASQTGADFDGKLGKFTAQISFSPTDLANSSFDVRVDTASVDTQDDERDTALRSPDLFSVEKYPQAHFVSSGFTSKGGDSYEARGKLTIRDVTREIRLPFTFAPQKAGGGASLKGAVQLKRLDYGVGQGDWKDTTWVANEVTVKFALQLAPAQSAEKQPAARQPAGKPPAAKKQAPAAQPTTK